MEDIVIWVYMEYMENAHKKHAHCTIEYGIPIESDSNYGENAQKYGMRVLQQFHSGLERTFLWVVDADSARSIEDLLTRTAGRFNTIKIVPLITFQCIIERCKQIEE